MSQILIGSDPEVILTKNGSPFSSVGLLGGTKTHPRKSTHGWIQEDNVLAEYNIEPAATAEEFINNHLLVLRDLTDIIKPLGLEYAVKASALYASDQLLTLQAITAGCEPDYDAWNLTVNSPPPIGFSNLRSAGGHLHVSFPITDEDDDRINLVRTMDILLGVPSVLMDEDLERRKLYGKAGAHRPKYKEEGHPYDGVEYRTLSNFWLSSEKLMAWAFNQTVKAVERMPEFVSLIESDGIDVPGIMDCINTGDKKFAENFCSYYDIEVA